MESSAPWIAIAQLLRPQGRRGELLADPLTDQTEVLTPGRELWLAKSGSNVPLDASSPRTLEEAWQPTGRNAGRWVLKLSGSDSISEAETLNGLEVLIPLAALPQLEEGTYFVRDLVGCELFDGETLVGEVVGLEFLVGADGRRQEDAAPLLAIRRVGLPAADASAPLQDPGEEDVSAEEAGDAEDAEDEADAGDQELIPFVEAWLESVDLEQRRIVMHLPAGLLDEAP